ncbi:MAG: restriction endonuclease subunit S, partial [Ruoffia tabacinasalis]
RLKDTDAKISKIGFNNSSAKWVKTQSILIALAGQGKTRGTVAINYIPLTTNQSIAAIEPNEEINAEYLYQNLNNRYDELRLKSSGDGTRGGLNKKIISELMIPIPELKEQLQIGLLLKTVDKDNDVPKMVFFSKELSRFITKFFCSL